MTEALLDGLALPSSVKIAGGRMSGVAAALALTDSEGIVSHFRIGESGRLQRWRGGRCCAKTIKTLVWSASTKPASAATTSGAGGETVGAGDETDGADDEAGCDVLTTTAGRPRVTVVTPAAGAAREALQAALRRLAAAGGTSATTQSELAQAKAARALARAATAAAGEAARPPQRGPRRREIEATLRLLSVPSAAQSGRCCVVSEPLASTESVLPELEQLGPGGASRFSGLQWSELPEALNMTRRERPPHPILRRPVLTGL
jgi:hypothetical protein